MAPSPARQPAQYRVKDLVVDLGSRKVSRGDIELRLSALTFDFLVSLIESSPAMVSYDELAAKVWDGRPTTPETIAQRAKLLRAALADDASTPKYFELVRGRGYRLVADDRQHSAKDAANRKSGWLAGTAVLLFVGVVALWLLQSRVTPPDENRIAVFPFRDLSPDADHAYLATSMTEVISNVLGNVDGLDVTDPYFVISNPQVLSNLQDAAQKLGVSTYLIGSVSRTGDDLRVITSLTDVETGQQLWTEIFNREFKDIFIVQQEIAMHVTGALGVTLGVTDSNEFIGAGTANIDAYEAFWRGNIDKAIELDPDYAAAWASKGLRLAASRFYGRPEDAVATLMEARKLVEKALELDPTSAHTLAFYGTLTYGTWQWEDAWNLYQRALSIKRDTNNLRHLANMYMRSGKSSDALEIHREADDLSPFGPRSNGLTANVLIALGLAEEAREMASKMGPDLLPFTQLSVAVNFGTQDDVRQAIEALPVADAATRYLFRPLLEHLDSPEDAIALLNEVAQNADLAWPWKNDNIGLMAAYFGDSELAFDVLYPELRSAAMRLGTLWFPVMSDVRKLPEFKEFLREIKIIQFWKDHGWSDFCRPVGEEDLVCE